MSEITTTDKPVYIDPRIFNVHKTDYHNTPLFLGQQNGLFDTINKRHKVFDDLFNRMAAYDWRETEFTFQDCNYQFRTCAPYEYDLMITTIAWQWEADTTAARSMIRILSAYITSPNLWKLFVEITKNEIVHASTYSRMVELSFDNPDEIITDVVSKMEALRRMERIAGVMSHALDVAIELETGKTARDSVRAYDAIMMLICALLCMERVQFVASFGVTFGKGNAGKFVQFSNAVSKICTDELEIHAETDFAILEIEFGTERGIEFLQRRGADIQALVDDVRQSELNWIDYIAANGADKDPDISIDGLRTEVDLNAEPVYRFFGFKKELPYLTGRRLPYMETMIKIDQVQGAAQEERKGNYMLGGIINNDEGVDFSALAADLV